VYVLQLVVSEDNVHSHEVTLHDLNILHDGSHLTGPLRLRLYATSPRFITRYNALREEITRLHLSMEGEDAYEGDAIDGEQTQEEPIPAAPQQDDQFHVETSNDTGENGATHLTPEQYSEGFHRRDQVCSMGGCDTARYPLENLPWV